MSSRGRRHPSLTQRLDREVEQIVRRLLDDLSHSGEPEKRLTPVLVYHEIQQSNSSLNRKPKKVLADSIGRILHSIQQDEEGITSDPAQEQSTIITQHEELPPPPPPSNSLNRSIVKAWTTATNLDHTMNDEAGQDRSEPTNAGTRPNGNAVVRTRHSNGEPTSKRRRVMAPVGIDSSPPTHVKLSDMAGVGITIKEMGDHLILPLMAPDVLVSEKIEPITGILLYGPKGCGKTMLVQAFGARLDVSFISIPAASIVSGSPAEVGKAIRDYFDEAKKCAPCLLFIDEIEVLAAKKDGPQRDTSLIVAQLTSCMADLKLNMNQNPGETTRGPVIVVATTNRPEALDPALRVTGRFDKEILMTIPNEGAREGILRKLTRDANLSSHIDFATLARRTPGWVGADLKDLVQTARAGVIRRVNATLAAAAAAAAAENGSAMEEHDLASSSPMVERSTLQMMDYLSERRLRPEEYPFLGAGDATKVTMDDFLAAIPMIQPSPQREGFAMIPTTSFASIGALETHITKLRELIIQPITSPEIYTQFGTEPTAGVLLWGPPGCGKTLLAEAVANASHANFISVKGPELLNKYVGESERAVRLLFSRARSSVPVILFFDEFDALAPRRDDTTSEASSRVVNTLLVELAGFGGARNGIFIIAATNRPDVIDKALLRPGRLGSSLFVGLPDADGRVDILKTMCRKWNTLWSERLADVARGCEGFSGADLRNLLDEAIQVAVRRCFSSAGMQKGGRLALTEDATITVADFEVAKVGLKRSVDKQQYKKYEQMQQMEDSH